MREVVLPDCPPPIFALGHSMGASVLIRAVRRGHRWFDRIVLSGPMIGIALVNSTAIAGTLLKVMRFAGLGIPTCRGAITACSICARSPVTF